MCRGDAYSIPGDERDVKSLNGFLQTFEIILLDEANRVRYAVAMESHTIRLKEPLIIPKELDENFLFMVDSSMLQLWPQLVRLCEMEKLSLFEVTERVATLDPLKIGMPEWYLYKMRSLLRAHFVGDDIQPRNVIIHAAEGWEVSFSVYDRRSLGQYLLAHVLLNR